jgi:hypothetical protein
VPRWVVPAAVLLLLAAARPYTQAPAPYTVFTPEGRRTLQVRAAGNAEMVSLERLAEWFSLTVIEDARVDGLTVRARDQLITLIPDQSFVSVGGRIDSLSAPVQRDRGGYLVPIDFLSRAVARALGQRIDVRRDSRIIVVGNVRVPRVTMGFEQSNGAGRLRIDIEPATPHRVAREGNRLTVQFDAVALDLVPLRDADASFVAGTRVADATLEVELGPSVSSFRVESATDDTSVTLDLLPPAPATPPTTPPAAPTPPSPPPSPPRPRRKRSRPRRPRPSPARRRSARRPSSPGPISTRS